MEKMSREDRLYRRLVYWLLQALGREAFPVQKNGNAV